MKAPLMFLASFAFVAHSAPAQATSQQCDTAVARVVGQRLPAIGNNDWGYWYRLRDCGAAAAPAVARQMEHSVLLTETNERRIMQFFGTFWGQRRIELYTALTSVSRNASATKPVRIAALTTLGKISEPMLHFDASEFARPRPAICTLSPTSTVAARDSNSLPADYRQAIIATMTAVEDEAGAPSAVRGAAHCWKVELERQQPFDVSKLKVLYVCGNMFRIQNKSPLPASVTYTVGKSGERGQTLVAPLSTSDFTVVNDGVFKLFYNAVEIDSKANGGTACP